MRRRAPSRPRHRDLLHPAIRDLPHLTVIDTVVDDGPASPLEHPSCGGKVEASLTQDLIAFLGIEAVSTSAPFM